MASVRGLPRRRGRPSKAFRLGRGAILPKSEGKREPPSLRRKRGGQSTSNEETSGGNLTLGDELDRWNEVKARQLLESDEEMARFLLDSWETKSAKRENRIQVGMATLRDFENYKTRTKRSSDEVIRFFLRLDIEFGQNVIPINDDIAKMFESLKSSMKKGANDVMKHLFDVKEKLMKKPEETKGNYLSGIERRVREAVREEMVQLMNEGMITTTPAKSIQITNSDTSSAKRDATTIDHSPDSGKKRPRKSLPQRVVIEQDEVSDSDIDAGMSQSMSSGGGGLVTTNTGIVNEAEVMQYNYVINSAQTAGISGTTVGLVGSPQVSWTSLSNPVTTIQLNAGNQVAGAGIQPGIMVYNNMSEKELEAKGIFKLGTFTIMKEPSGLLSCPQCDYKNAHIPRLRRHFTLHTGKEYLCSQCDKTYTEEYKLKDHIHLKHEKSVYFRCPICDRDFNSKGGLKYHTRTIHRKDFAYWCDSCCKGYNFLQFYQAHMNKHNGRPTYKCNSCSKDFSYLATLSMHRKTCMGTGQANGFSCEMCGETFTTDKYLQDHLKAEHSDVTKFRCICGAEFQWKNALDNHKAKCIMQKKKLSPKKVEVDGLSNMMIVNVESLSTKNQQVTPISMYFEGDSNKSTGTNVDFDDNSCDSVQIMNIESGEQFVCDITGENDDDDEDYLPHSGTGIMHACQFCDYKTQKSSHLKRHELTHTGKKYKCHDCPKSFCELNKLRTHQNSKHQGRAKYKCDKCSRTFSSKGGIMYHQQTKHNNSYKYKCETCDKGFNTIQHYLGHKNTHTGIRPYVCDKCNVGFSYPSVLTSHKRVCKGKVEGLNAGGIDLYPCKDCKEKFALPSALQQHVKEMHNSSSRMKYMCDCGEAFELHALYELHKSRCSKCDKSTEMILQTVSVEADSTENANNDVEEFRQLSPEKFNAILCNQPVFPS